MNLMIQAYRTRIINYRGINKMDNKAEDKKPSKLVSTIDNFYQQAQNKLPENFKYFQRISEGFKLDNSNNYAIFEIKHNTTDDDSSASLYLIVQNFDYGLNEATFFFKGTRDELLKKLISLKKDDSLKDIFDELSQRLDKHIKNNL